MTRKTSLSRRLGQLASQYWGILALLLAWQAWVTFGQLNEIVMPEPLAVLGDILGHGGLYLANGAQTLAIAVAGLALGMLFGTLIAVLSWTSRLLNGMLVPVALVLSSIPVVAMIPILARLLGYDLKTVLAIVIIISFFPALVFTAAGLKALPHGSDDLFRVFGARRWTRFVNLVLPAAVPSWMIAFRLTAPPAILVAMVAEFLMASGGLGEMFRDAADKFDMARAFGTSLVATLVSVISFLGATWAERKVKERWT